MSLHVCSPLTLAISVEIEDTAGSHHCLQGDDLIERHAEQLVLIEPPRWRMMRLMRTEVVVAKGKPLTPLEFEWIKKVSK